MAVSEHVRGRGKGSSRGKRLAMCDGRDARFTNYRQWLSSDYMLKGAVVQEATSPKPPKSAWATASTSSGLSANKWPPSPATAS